MKFKDIEKLEQTENGMRFREAIPDSNDEYVTYKYKDIVILSPINAYLAFVKVLEKIYQQDKDKRSGRCNTELGELIPQFYFDSYDGTDYSRSWVLWEESIMEVLREEYEESKQKKDGVQDKTD